MQQPDAFHRQPQRVGSDLAHYGLDALAERRGAGRNGDRAINLDSHPHILELAAGTTIELASPVAGVVARMSSIVQTAIVTGGDLTAKIGATDIAGLTITVADAATKGTVQTDTPTAGDASTVVAVGDRIQIVPAAAFNGGGALAGFIEIELA